MDTSYKEKYFKYKQKYLKLQQKLNNNNQRGGGEEVPKKIHALWLDFKENKDGIIPDYLNVYVDRIKELHDGWEIKIWTSWSEIENELSNRSWMLNYVRNPYCNPANKSDCLRFHILEKYGGVWVDLSTYFIKSLDELYNEYKYSFNTLYMHPYDALMWVMDPLSKEYEDITIEEKINNVFPNLNKFAKLKNEFICESYFLMSPPNHSILLYVLNRMEQIWSEDIVSKITDKNSHCNHLNNVMDQLVNEAFEINNEVLKIIEYNIKIYDCGYLWIYFLITFGVKNFIDTNKDLIKKEIPLTQGQKDVLCKIPTDIKSFTCNNSTCTDIVYCNSDGKKMLHLISASWLRTVKWSNVRDERLTWKNTFVGNLIDDSDNKKVSSDDFLNELNKYNIVQLKTGAYTRDTTKPMIQKLDSKIHNNNNL